MTKKISQMPKSRNGTGGGRREYAPKDAFSSSSYKGDIVSSIDLMTLFIPRMRREWGSLGTLLDGQCAQD